MLLAMGGKPVFLWLTVLGLCCAVAEAATTASPTTEVPASSTATSTTTEAAPPKPRVRVDEYEYYEEAQGSLKLLPAADWHAARNLCFKEDAELASPETDGMLAAMTTAMLSAVHPVDQVFTGVNDLYFREYFSSLRGTPLSSLAARWAPGAARGAPGARCLTMAPYGALRGAQCNDTLPYFCFKKTEPGPENECGTNPDYFYHERESSCYKWHNSSLNWGEAYAACLRDGAHLLVPTPGFVEDMPVMRERMHVGLTRWGGEWVTVQGEPLSKSGFNEWSGDAMDNALDSTLDSKMGGACASYDFESRTLISQDCAQELTFLCVKKAYI